MKVFKHKILASIRLQAALLGFAVFVAWTPRLSAGQDLSQFEWPDSLSHLSEFTWPGQPEDYWDDPYNWVHVGWLTPGHVPIDSLLQLIPFSRIEFVSGDAEEIFKYPTKTLTIHRRGDTYLRTERLAGNHQYRGTITPHSFGRLAYMIEKLGVLDMKPYYGIGVSHANTFGLRIWPDDGSEPTVVVDRGNWGPVELWVASVVFERIIEVSEWEEF